MRTDIVTISNELNNLSELNLEIYELIDCIKKFSNACILKKDTTKNVLKLSEAKSQVLTGLNIIKGIVKSKENRLIYEFESKNQNIQDDLDKYLQNFVVLLDTNQKQLTKDIKDAKNEVLAEIILPTSTKNFVEELKSIMENVIIYPLTLATKVYKELYLDERRTKYPIKEFFEYILFIQILNASKIGGSEERRKAILSSGVQAATFQENQYIKMGKQKQPIGEKIEKQEEPKEELEDFDDLYFTEEEI